MESFSKLEYQRREHSTKHSLLEIIDLTLLATMSGSQCYTEIELFGELHEEYLSDYLLLSNGITSHDTISRVMSSIEPSIFNSYL